MSDDPKRKRALSTAETFEKKGKKEWARAKNDEGGHHYENAKNAFDRAKKCRDAAEKFDKK